MMGRLTVLWSLVPSASSSPERRGSTDPDPKLVIPGSGSPELRELDPQSSIYFGLFCFILLWLALFGIILIIFCLFCFSLWFVLVYFDFSLFLVWLESRATDFGSGNAHAGLLGV